MKIEGSDLEELHKLRDELTEEIMEEQQIKAQIFGRGQGWLYKIFLWPRNLLLAFFCTAQGENLGELTLAGSLWKIEQAIKLKKKEIRHARNSYRF